MKLVRTLKAFAAPGLWQNWIIAAAVLFKPNLIQRFVMFSQAQVKRICRKGDGMVPSHVSDWPCVLALAVRLGLIRI